MPHPCASHHILFLPQAGIRFISELCILAKLLKQCSKTLSRSLSFVSTENNICRADPFFFLKYSVAIPWTQFSIHNVTLLLKLQERNLKRNVWQSMRISITLAFGLQIKLKILFQQMLLRPHQIIEQQRPRLSDETQALKFTCRNRNCALCNAPLLRAYSCVFKKKFAHRVFCPAHPNYLLESLNIHFHVVQYIIFSALSAGVNAGVKSPQSSRQSVGLLNVRIDFKPQVRHQYENIVKFLIF